MRGARRRPGHAVHRLLDDRTDARRLRIAAELEQRGMTMLDAPVTGSSPRAQDGTLTFMVGG